MLWKLDPAWLMMAVATVAVLSYYFGTALNAVMRGDGFGPFGNAIIVSISFFVAILFANEHGYNLRELHLAVSRDERTFTRLAKLDIPSPPQETAQIPATLFRKLQAAVASPQYPHAIEHDGHLFVAFSRNKVQTDVLRVPLTAVDAMLPGPERTHIRVALQASELTVSYRLVHALEVPVAGAWRGKQSIHYMAGRARISSAGGCMRD